MLVLPGCDKAGALEKKMKAEAPLGCDAYCGTASCGITCKDADGLAKAKLLFVAHCAEIKEIGTSGRVQMFAQSETNEEFDSSTCTFKPK